MRKTTISTTEPEPCPACRGQAGRDCTVCNGVGFKPFHPVLSPPQGTKLFHPSLIPDIEPLGAKLLPAKNPPGKK